MPQKRFSPWMNTSATTWQRTSLLIVFFLGLGLRIYWITQKTGFHGDELTSLSIIWNGVDGNGHLMHDAHRIYQAEELRHFFADETGGLHGLRQDLRALWENNQDVPHASLYYMLLRCALTAVSVPSAQAVIAWGCGLNLLFFAIGFFAAARMLCSHSGKWYWPAFALGMGYLNSISVSNTLFLREYALAEMAVMLLFYQVLRLREYMHEKRPLFRPSVFLPSIGVTTLALSCGYVNALLVLFLACWLGAAAYKERLFGKSLAFVLSVGLLATLFCWALYAGFFNYVLDPRIARTSDKLQVTAFPVEIGSTIKGFARLLILRLLSPVGSILLVASLWFTIRHKRKLQVSIPKGMWVCLCLWLGIYLFLVPWKDERFLAPGAPLLMFLFAALSYRLLPLLTLCACCTSLVPNLISYRSPTNQINLDRCHRLVLLGPDAEERKMASLLTAEIGTGQELVIVESQDEIIHWQSPRDTSFLLLTATYEKPEAELLTHYTVASEGKLNLWMNYYELRRKPSAETAKPPRPPLPNGERQTSTNPLPSQ